MGNANTKLTTKFTAAQAWILRQMLEGRTQHTGRNGHSLPAMRALERRGMVKVLRVHRHETDWKLTPAGLDAARDEVRRYRAERLAADGTEAVR